MLPLSEGCKKNMTLFFAGVLIIQVELFLLYFVIFQKLEVGVVNVEPCVNDSCQS